ncbi:50S ribosomal protein L24 [bacterium]|nr:50S ribosomal protein L24 [bacterium]
MKIKKGDQVLVISGKDRGRKGKVIKALPKEGKVIIEGMNIKKKHIRPRRQGEKGQIAQIPAPIDVSNVKLICPKCGKPTRVGYKKKVKSNGEKVKTRICKKCKQEI